MKARLQVMKFGGTSVGDASCIARTAQIIAKAAKEGGCVAVVSAMSGVTNRLIEAAKKAQAGDAREAAAILDTLRQQHETALTSLVQQEDERARIRQRMEEVFAEGRRIPLPSVAGCALVRLLAGPGLSERFRVVDVAYREWPQLHARLLPPLSLPPRSTGWLRRSSRRLPRHSRPPSLLSR